MHSNRSNDINMDSLSPNASPAPISQQPTSSHGMGAQRSFACEYASEDEFTKHGLYGSMMNAAGNIVGAFGAVPCCLCFPTPYVALSNQVISAESIFMVQLLIFELLLLIVTRRFLKARLDLSLDMVASTRLLV